MRPSELITLRPIAREYFCKGLGGSCDLSSFPTRRSSDLWQVTLDQSEHRRRSIYLFAKRNVRLVECLQHRNPDIALRSEEHTSELQSHHDLLCRLMLEKKKAWNSWHCSPLRQ